MERVSDATDSLGMAMTRRTWLIIGAVIGINILAAVVMIASGRPPAPWAQSALVVAACLLGWTVARATIPGVAPASTLDGDDSTKATDEPIYATSEAIVDVARRMEETARASNSVALAWSPQASSAALLRMVSASSSATSASSSSSSSVDPVSTSTPEASEPEEGEAGEYH